MTANPKQVETGMKVYAADGLKLGKVIGAGPTSFAIEKGFFFPKAYLVSYAEVANVDEKNHAHLIRTKDEFLSKRRSTPRDEARRLQSPPPPSTTSPREKLTERIADVDDVLTYKGPSDSPEQPHMMKSRTPDTDEERAREPSRPDADKPVQT